MYYFTEERCLFQVKDLRLPEKVREEIKQPMIWNMYLTCIEVALPHIFPQIDFQRHR
jgi:hypothetical protein